MAASAGSGDAWRISGEDRAKHDSQFFMLKPINGFVTGEQARGFFMQSGLPTAVLGQIWGLADMNNDGKMDKKEFSIAMHLIKKKLQGYELPKSLPSTLKADPSPVIGSFGTMPSQPAGMMPGGMSAGMGMPGMGMAPTAAMGMVPRVPMMSNGPTQMASATPGYMLAHPVPVSGGYSGAMPSRAQVPAVAGMGMPHQSKLKYTQMFNTHDRNKKGALTGVEARSILMQTGVPQQMLAQVWNLSDVDKDGQLDCEEFCIAMHLTDHVRMGTTLPAKLPADLMPTKLRSGSFGSIPPPPVVPAAPGGPGKDNFGDLLGGMGMPAPVPPAPVTNGEAKPEDDSNVTFEDRRKENFDKGQAELERRRQMLQDQMKKENEARLEKERQEQEKRDKHRHEQEMKRQQELERQMEKQRQIERQREEQRQKMLEQRESARRELERQRQMEWESQRKEQLMIEKAREYEQLTSLKSRSSDLKCELESLQGKKEEISTKISQVRNGVTDFTAHIEAMRSTRDLKNQDIDRLQGELQELNKTLHEVQSERQTLDLKMQTSVQANPMSETHRTMMHSVELKKTSVQRLKKDLEQIEKDTATKLADIDTLNTQMNDSNKTLSHVQTELSSAERQKQDNASKATEEEERIKKEKDKHEKLRKELEAQRLKEESERNSTPTSTVTTNGTSSTSGGNWFDFGGDTKTSTTSSDNWASVFDSQPSHKASSEAWGSAFSSQNKTDASADQKLMKLSGPTQKYRAMYQFDARNDDELSLLPGDTVEIFDDQKGAEPGWKGGELNGRRGWFPEAYVEKIAEEPSTSNFTAADTNSDSGQVAGLGFSEDSSFMTVPGKVPAVSPTPGQGQAAPEGLQAQALYPWKAKKDNHLTFNKGDIIYVREQQDMWWSGELAGKVGWFPKSYVKLISGPSAATSTAAVMNTVSSPPTVVTVDSPVADSPAMDKPAGSQFIALYTYTSTEAVDLTFNQGEIILVTQMEGDWWTGNLGSDRTGIFPANYVKKYDAPDNDPSDLTVDIGVTPEYTLTDNTDFSEDPFGNPSVTDSNFGAFPSTTDPLSDPFPNDPFNQSNSDVLNDPFPSASDPFSSGQDEAKDPFTKSSSLNADPLADAFSSDPFNQGPDGATDHFGQTNDTSIDPLSVVEPFGGSAPAGTSQSNSTNIDLTSSLTTPDPFNQTASAANYDLDLNEAFSSENFGSSAVTTQSSLDVSLPGGTASTGLASNNSLLTETSSASCNNDLSEDVRLVSDESDRKKKVSFDLTPKFSDDPNNADAATAKLKETATDEAVFTDDPFANEGFDGMSETSFSNNQADMNISDSDQASTNADLFSNIEAAKADVIVPAVNPEAVQSPNSSVFSDYPFAGENFGNDLQSDISSSPFSPDTPSSDQSGSTSDPFAAFNDMSNDLGETAVGKLERQPSWVNAVEADAFSSLSLDLGPIAGTNAPQSGSDNSIQTSDSLSDLQASEAAVAVVSDPGDESVTETSNSESLGEISAENGISSSADDTRINNNDSFKPEESVDHGIITVNDEVEEDDSSEPPPLPEKTGARRPDLLQLGSDLSPPTDQLTAEGSKRKYAPRARVKPSSTAPAAPSATPSGTGTLKKPEIATVIAAYTATGEEQLSLSPGQLIQVRKKSPSGWWEGELQARGQKRKIGWFPANYVKLLGSSARSTPDNTLNRDQSPATAMTGGSSANPSPAPAASTPQPSAQTYADHVIALYPYSAQNADELTFQKDAVINVIKKDDPDWWQGEYNGQMGMFPSNYVQSTTPDSTSWSSDPQVLAVTSVDEGKRQTYIHELITTEESYMTDMSIVLKAFYEPIRDGEGMTEDQLRAVFVNWKDLIVCNTKLQKALRVRKKMCGVDQVVNSIGDILCENIPHLTPYIRFCSCQLNAAALLQKISETNPKFNEIHKKCVQNPKTKGMPLSSFLLKPMQRITKYPLIVEKILKYTPEGHPDHSHLQEALESCQELCSQVNEGVREKENSDRLEWIQQHVNCDGLPEKITFNSITNCLGPRKLLHTGVLYKSKSNKELAAFLFNDFFLLTTSNRPLSSATHSLFDVTGHVQYKMYKSPIFLNEVMVKKNEESPDQFQISHIEHVYHLKCNSGSERDTWDRRLGEACKNYLDTERKKIERAISSPKASRGVGRLLVIIIEGKNLICSKDVRRSPGVGRLLVVIIEGKDLQSSDINGKSDPYCEVSMGAQEHKTKVINNTLNPKWNASMQFTIRDMDMDALCITVFDRDLFSPNDFLGRTEIRVVDIMEEASSGGHGRKPVVKHLLLHEVATGEVVVKLDLHVYDRT